MEEKEILLQLVKESSSLSDILRKQGKSVSGDSVKLLKAKLELYEIPYHFIPIHKTLVKKELSEILQDNVNFKSSDLKKRLIEAGLKEDKCECCGQLPEWNGKHLTLQLHHMNGKHSDNRFENLQILCPNCHTQTDNFVSKKSKNYCIDCGKEITSQATRCIKCSVKQNRIKIGRNIPSKETLLELIQTKSFVDIGKMFGVSDNAVRKWCRRYKIPKSKSELKQHLQQSNIFNKEG